MAKDGAAGGSSKLEESMLRPEGDEEAPPQATLRRGASIRTTEEERSAVSRCLLAVEHQVQKRQTEGLSTMTFFLGVVNSHFVVFFFAGFTQHFWLVYMLETMVMFPIRFYRMYHATPMRTTRYMLDFCYVANIVGNVTLLILMVDQVLAWQIFSGDTRRVVFCAFWGIANGVLLLSTGLLGNALVFHDMDNTVSMFIHLFPALLMYGLRWHSTLVTKAWPGIFRLDYFDSVRPWQDIFVLGFACYACWWVVYILWLTIFAMRLPETGSDTIFHWSMRGTPGEIMSKITGRPKDEMASRAKTNDLSRTDALLYLTFHAIAVCVALTVGVANFYSKTLHASVITVMALITIYNGSSRYSHYLLRSYGDIIRRELGITE